MAGLTKVTESLEVARYMTTVIWEFGVLDNMLGLTVLDHC
jgi:hypothetical protein